MSNLLEEIEERLGNGSVLRGDDVKRRAVSYWDSSPMAAQAIVRPKSTDDVSFVLSLCNAKAQAVFVHGGRTTCVAGTTSRDSDIVLSLERMNHISEIDPVSNTVTVEAGAVLERVQQAARREGFLFPLDLGARGTCTIGGNLSTNAGGISVIRYGMVRSLALGLEAVLPDGTVISSMDKMLKNNAGFDLKQLFIGTEGTLGVITRAILRLRPLPLTRNTALVSAADFESVTKLLNSLHSRLGGDLSAFEMMEGEYFYEVTEPGWHAAPMDRTAPYYVICESEGSDPARDADHFLEAIEAAMVDGMITDAVIPKSETERSRLWAIRDDFEAILQKKPVYLYDVSLSIGDIPQYIGEVREQAMELVPGSTVFTIGHVGDSNLHFFVQAPSDIADSRALADRAVYEPLRKYGGSVSAEHGIGFEKKSWLTQSRTRQEIQLMRLLKTSIDPNRILNPGVVID